MAVVELVVNVNILFGFSSVADVVLVSAKASMANSDQPKGCTSSMSSGKLIQSAPAQGTEQ